MRTHRHVCVHVYTRTHTHVHTHTCTQPGAHVAALTGAFKRRRRVGDGIEGPSVGSKNRHVNGDQ